MTSSPTTITRSRSSPAPRPAAAIPLRGRTCTPSTSATGRSSSSGTHRWTSTKRTSSGARSGVVMTTASVADYPVRLRIDYPDRSLNRATTFFRLIAAIPIVIVVEAVSGGSSEFRRHGAHYITYGAGGMLFIGPLLMIVFRQKYPRWWFDWNLQLQRFSTRVGVYLALMDDQYPSTEEDQSVHLDYDYPDVPNDLNRWLPLVKWLLAIPHFIVLFFLYIGALFAVIAAWFAILFTGRYPEGLFRYVEGVVRWSQRVIGYAFLLVTDAYPPFRLAA